MSVKHIVLIHAAHNADQENLSKIFSSVMGFKDRCMKNGRTYIRSVTGGIDNNGGNMQAGITHAFIIEFESRADRDYYAEEDPVHQEAIQSLRAAIGTDIVTAQVVDFTPNEF